MPSWFTRDLESGMSGVDVLVVQRKLGAPLTGVYDEETEARVRGVQMAARKKTTGRVDKETAEKLGEDPAKGQTPEWFAKPLSLRDLDRSVRCVRCRLGVENKQHDLYDADVERAVRRFQSGHKLPVTGVVDEKTAQELGDCCCQREVKK